MDQTQPLKLRWTVDKNGRFVPIWETVPVRTPIVEPHPAEAPTRPFVVRR